MLKAHLFKMSTSLFITVMLQFFYAQVFADFGSCRYDPDLCSCKIGKANEGTCWDPIVGQPGQCSKRFCAAGWTCSCAGRTHLCNRAAKSVSVLKNPTDVSKSVADCETKSFPLVSSQDIVLGTFRIHLSRTGLLANDCTQISWYHNGELLGTHGLVSDMSETTVDKHKTDREEHSLLELRPGDVIGFRIKEGSYYCYNHLSELVVNGTSVRTTAPTVQTWYARKYFADWYMPSYKLTEANTATDESETDLTKFLLLRRTKLTSGETIVDGNDYWEPRDDTNRDNKRSNWYYRIQIGEDLTGL